MSGAVEGVALLPCPNPWCEGAEGVEASQHIVSGKWHICCDDCMIEGPWADSYNLAIAAWNTRSTPPARSYADGVEDAAKVAEDLTFGIDIGEWLVMTKKDVSARACHECAAAIRLLSQGEKA
jgi:hypothetical protein